MVSSEGEGRTSPNPGALANLFEEHKFTLLKTAHGNWSVQIWTGDARPSPENPTKKKQRYPYPPMQEIALLD